MGRGDTGGRHWGDTAPLGGSMEWNEGLGKFGVGEKERRKTAERLEGRGKGRRRKGFIIGKR